jgi:hypothetical protein
MTLIRGLPAGRELLLGPARCPPPAPGRSEYWGRVKPRRGLPAHTPKTAPVCAACVPAPNL